MQKRLGENERACVRHLFEEFLQLLKQNDHNGHYFVRGDTSALCLSDGQFSCQGTFSKDQCSGRLHVINPYASREQLVIFSTWNLDHRIERSRSILPTMSKAIQLADGRTVNAEYFYRLLFTTENLKLVHPVCHIKSEHDGYCCDPGSWYTDNTTQNDGRGDESVKRMRKSEQSSEWLRGKRKLGCVLLLSVDWWTTCIALQKVLHVAMVPWHFVAGHQSTSLVPCCRNHIREEAECKNAHALMRKPMKSRVNLGALDMWHLVACVVNLSTQYVATGGQAQFLLSSKPYT